MFIGMMLLGLPPILCQCVLEKLINDPCNCRRRNLKDYTSRCAGEKPGKSTQPVHRSCRGHNAVDVLALLRDGTSFLRIQQRLADIEWSRESGGNCSGKSAGKHMRHRPILSVAVYEILAELVDDKMKTLIRNIEYQLRAEAVIECPPAFFNEYLPSAVKRRPIWRSIHLHSLLNYCNHTNVYLK